MDSFVAIVMAILAVCMLVLIAIYNNLDRMRFRLDRMLKGAWPALNDWADACEELKPGSAAEYRKARQNWKRTACLQEMVTQVPENSEEKLDIQEQLLDFCYRYSQMAYNYNKKIEDPITGKLVQLLGFKPYTPLDFYPDIQVPKKNEEK